MSIITAVAKLIDESNPGSVVNAVAASVALQRRKAREAEDAGAEAEAGGGGGSSVSS